MSKSIDTTALYAAGFGPRILITGSEGFLGRSLAKRVSDLGLHVTGFDIRPTAAATGERRAHVVGDIRDRAVLDRALAGVDTVFHTAAVISMLRHNRSKTREFVFSVNVGGTELLLDVARAAGVKRFVYTSSHNVGLDGPVVQGDEDTTPYPSRYLDLYTETKVAAEKLVLAADNPAGMRTVALRPAGIWGPADDSVMMATFLENVAAGKFIATVGDGSAELDNTHVDNLVDAEVLAAQKLVDTPEVVGGQAYYIHDDEPMNASEWFRPLTDALGVPFPKRKLPAAPLIWALDFAEWLHVLGLPAPALTRSNIVKITTTHTFRLDKARRDLGYAPRVQRADGLAAGADWARDFVARKQAARR